MGWVRLEDTFPEHPKLLTAGGDAGWLHVCAIAYCSRNLTDGFIPSKALRQLSDRRQPIKLAYALIDAGLWSKSSNGNEGFQIHDYLDYHPTRAEVVEHRAQRSEIKAQAGRLGGIASGIARRKQTRSTIEANGQANTKRNEAPTRPDPTRTGITTYDDDSVDTPEPSSSISEASRETARNRIAWAAARTLAGKRTDLVNRTGWVNRTAEGLIRERLGDIDRCINARYSMNATLEVLCTEPAPPPTEIREAWYADPHCETCDGDGVKPDPEHDGYYLPCHCRRPDEYTGTIIPLRKEAP